jgi:hypothetical protein
MKDTITVTVNGNTYQATREITGTRKLHQSLTFQGHTEADSKTYLPTERKEMDIVANLILWQLVTRGWTGQFPLESPEHP